jgi:hypothetical protein
MWKIGLATTSALALVVAGAALVRADDISAKKLSIKDNANPAKRQIQVLSSDGGVTLSGADDPGTNGAAIHVYSATDDFCAILPAGAGWQHKNSGWKYKNKATKASAQVGDGKLSVKLKSGITYTLADNGTQGPVNVQVQFGTGTRYCMKCVTAKKNTAKKYQAKACAPASCDSEPSVCAAGSTTSTTVTGTSTTTSSCSPGPGTVLKGSLTATPGRFNYNLTLGLPGANAACNTNFPGTHACTHAELQNAQAAGDLTCLKDIGANTVTSFWAIDNSQPPLQQCQDDVSSFKNWEYATAHTSSRGQKVALNNATGVLGSRQSGLQCNTSGNSWVGCCQ